VSERPKIVHLNPFLAPNLKTPEDVAPKDTYHCAKFTQIGQIHDHRYKKRNKQQTIHSFPITYGM